MNQPDPYATQVTNSPPRKMGRYLYRRPLGAGGLGVVSIYFDTELNREVALKEIRSDRADDSRQRQYFCAEAEVTGMLEHPGIVPIYSMGTNPDGRPYYAMRLITGNEFRDDIVRFHKAVQQGAETFLGPTLRHLLRRLVDVCNVIQYSHSRGVLHRDLKSANVMLGRYGETLVIDWGLSKATGVSEVEETSDDVDSVQPQEELVSVSTANLRHTQDGIAMGTIAYAPPEQLNGRVRDIDSRSDTYSLGAILYEVLTGDPPGNSMDLTQALRAINQGAISPAHQVRNETPKPLSAIASKALSAKKEKRYQTAEQLKNDLQRWLDDEPVSAYAESRWERVYRWKRRHETFVRLSTLFLALVTIVSLVSLYGINAARNQQQQARTEATRLYQLARIATDQLLTRTSDRLSEIPDATDVQRELLRDAVESYKQMSEVGSNDPELRRESARVLMGLAKVQRELEETAEAVGSLRSARQMLESLNTVEDQILVARAYVDESRLHSDQIDNKAAQAAISDALLITETLTSGDSVSTAAWLVRGQAFIQRGVVAADLEDHTKSIESFDSAARVLRDLLDRELAENEQHNVRLELTRALNNLAMKQHEQQPKDTAVLQIYMDAMNQAESLRKQLPTDPVVIKEYAGVLNNFGIYYLDTKNLQAAAATYQSATDKFANLSADKPNIAEYKELWILTLIGLGNVNTEANQHAEALTNYQQAVEVADQLLDQNRNRISFMRAAAQAYYALGCALATADGSQAEQMFKQGQSLLPKTDRDLHIAYVEQNQLEMLNQTLDREPVKAIPQRLNDYILSTVTFRSADALFNSACLIVRSCQSIVNGSSSVKPDVDSYLDFALARLAMSIELDPDHYQHAQDDSDLTLLRERRSQALESLRPTK